MRRPLPSPATLIALLALFVALGAGAYAATKAPKNSVTSKSIKNGNVKGKDLAAGAVDTKNIKGDAVNGAQIAAGAVGSQQIADGSIAVGDLEAAAQPDRDLDLLRGERVTVDDPADGFPATTVTLLNSGPFTVKASCQDNGANAVLKYLLSSTEHGWVNTSSVSPADYNAGETQPLSGGGVIAANNTGTGGGYAITDSGRFLSFAAIGVSKPGGATDCIFQASGWGG